MYFHVLVYAKSFHDTMDFNSGVTLGFWEAEIGLNITTASLFFSNTFWGILRK